MIHHLDISAYDDVVADGAKLNKKYLYNYCFLFMVTSILLDKSYRSEYARTVMLCIHLQTFFFKFCCVLRRLCPL
jgi:hypothetical protein